MEKMVLIRYQIEYGYTIYKNTGDSLPFRDRIRTGFCISLLKGFLTHSYIGQTFNRLTILTPTDLHNIGIAPSGIRRMFFCNICFVRTEQNV